GFIIVTIRHVCAYSFNSKHIFCLILIVFYEIVNYHFPVGLTRCHGPLGLEANAPGKENAEQKGAGLATGSRLFYAPKHCYSPIILISTRFRRPPSNSP